MIVDVDIQPRPIELGTPVETYEIEIVNNLDALSESAVCSCSAGDDNPF